MLALLLVWALMGVVAVAVYRRWGGLAALVPLVTVGLWFLLATLGEQLLGWTVSRALPGVSRGRPGSRGSRPLDTSGSTP